MSDKPYQGVLLGPPLTNSSKQQPTSKMPKPGKKVGLDSRSQGRRNVQGAASTSVGRKDKRDASAIRKERI